MTKILCYSLLSVMLAVPAYAGQTTIQETETGIVVEYTPDEEDSKVAQTMRELNEKKRETEEESKKKLEEKRATRRANSEKIQLLGENGEIE